MSLGPTAFCWPRACSKSWASGLGKEEDGMDDRIKRHQDDIDLEDATSLPDEDGGVAEALAEDDEEFEEND